jgi:cysteine desulfuration protein SufE
MSSLESFLKQAEHAALLDEYHALESAEDKLTWLMERAPAHRSIPVSDCTPERRIPGCLSGLWLQADIRQGLCFFSCASESEVVQGIGSLICDLYSNRPSDEILRVGAVFASALKLDGLLTLTRRRAVSSVISFILQRAALVCAEDGSMPDRAA